MQIQNNSGILVGGEKLLELSAGLDKKGDVKVTYDKQNIAEISVDLTEDNFLKTNYNLNTENGRKLYVSLISQKKKLPCSVMSVQK